MLDTSFSASDSHIKPVRTTSQPLRSLNYGTLVQAKRYVSASQPPPWAVPVGSVRPSLQRFHSGHRSISGQPVSAPANIGYFSTPQSPMTGAFLHVGHDDWNREAPKHTFHPMAPVGPFHPDVPESMRLRPPVPQAEVVSSHWKHRNFSTQEQLHRIREDRGQDIIKSRHPRGHSSSYSNHQNRSRGFSRSTTGTPRFFGSSVPTPQSGNTNLSIVTGYPQDINSNLALGHPGAVGSVPFPLFQPSQFVQPEYPRNEQNLTMGNQNITSAPQNHGGHNQRARRGSTNARRGRMNFSNDARVLEKQDAYRRQDSSNESNPYEEQLPPLPLRRPRQDSNARPPYHSSFERHSTAHMGRVSYAQGDVHDAGHSVQGLGPSAYAEYILKHSRDNGDPETVESSNRRRGHHNSLDSVSPSGQARLQEQEMHLTKGHGLSSNTDNISQSPSAHENRVSVSQHLQANPNVAYNQPGGEGDFILPQNDSSAANQTYASYRPNQVEPRRAIGGQGLSQHVPENVKFTRIWVGGLPSEVGMD